MNRKTSGNIEFIEDFSLSIDTLYRETQRQYFLCLLKIYIAEFFGELFYFACRFHDKGVAENREALRAPRGTEARLAQSCA
ncbi:MAG TPA: hypothetical protein PLY93_07570, partial [Turneriella sp.]|nr:hypothetical protein [Turneriella sp.]